MSLYADDFFTELETILAKARDLGLVAVEVNSGNLHRRLGGYPGLEDRMPVCCDVMRQAMGLGDTVVIDPPKGDEANLTIRYSLPRPN